MKLIAASLAIVCTLTFSTAASVPLAPNAKIQEIHAVLFNLPDAEPTGWEPEYGPGRGGK